MVVEHSIAGLVTIRRVASALLAAGILARLVLYGLDRPLWLDSVKLAESVIHRPFLDQLVAPMMNSQRAPLGFMFVAKVLSAPFSYSEFGLYLFPLVSGIGALAIFFLMCRSMGRGGIIALVPFALSSTLIYYSAEFKQYSTELFVSTGLVFLASSLFSKNAWSGRDLLPIALAGLVSVFFSFTAVIVLAGIGFHALLRVRSDSRNRLRVIGMGAVWLGALAVTLVVAGPMEHMREIHADGFLPLPSSFERIEWYLTTISGYFVYPLGFSSSKVGLIFAVPIVLGSYLVVANRDHRSKFAFLPAIIGFYVLASALKLYPLATGHYAIYSRFALFSVPVFLLLMALGYRHVEEVAFRRYAKPFAVGVIGLTLGSIGYQAVFQFPKGIMWQDVRIAVRTLRAREVDLARVWVLKGASSSFRYYTGLPLEGIQPLTDLKQVRQLRRWKEAWVVSAHDFSGFTDSMIEEARALGMIVGSVDSFRGARLIKFVPTRP